MLSSDRRSPLTAEIRAFHSFTCLQAQTAYPYENQVELTDYREENEESGPGLPPGAATVVESPDPEASEGMIFCLEGATEAAAKHIDPSYPLSPCYLVYVGEDGEVVHDFAQLQETLWTLRGLCAYERSLERTAAARFDEETKDVRDMDLAQTLLAAAFS